MNDLYDYGKWKLYIMGAIILTPIVTDNFVPENIIEYVDRLTENTYDIIIELIKKDEAVPPKLTFRFDMQQATTLGYNGVIKIEDLCKQYIRNLILDNVDDLYNTMSGIINYYK